VLAVVPTTQHLHRAGRRRGLDGQRSYICRCRRLLADTEQFPKLPKQQHQPSTLQRQRPTHHVRLDAKRRFHDFSCATSEVRYHLFQLSFPCTVFSAACRLVTTRGFAPRLQPSRQPYHLHGRGIPDMRRTYFLSTLVPSGLSQL